MKPEQKEFSGRIIIDEYNISFVIKDFEVVFLSPDFSEFKNQRKSFNIKPEQNGFIFGKTYEGFDIAIYIGNEFELKTMVRLKTWLYLVFDNNTKLNKFEFQEIQFFGGTLNTLYYSQMLEKDFDSNVMGEENKIVLKYNLNNGLTYEINEENLNGALCLFSKIIERNSFTKGVEIINDGSGLILEFEETKELGEFIKYYNAIMNLCQFMAYRQNIDFDEVLLLKKEKDSFSNKIATCYIKRCNDRTEKHTMRSITFNDLGESVVALLVSILKNSQNKPSYCMNFLPKDDKDVMIMDNTKLKNICSAIECEMNIAKIAVSSDENYDRLIKDIKDLVKKHKESDNPLSDKTYDFIFGNISHWNQALSDRIYEAYLLHKEEIKAFLINFHYEFSKESIENLVKYRNSITHGSYMVIDKNIFYTAVVIGALVYCCLLSRIGMCSEKIKDLMKQGILIY